MRLINKSVVAAEIEKKKENCRISKKCRRICMEESLKQLLLKDLSARLPYKVRLKIGNYSDYVLYGITPNREQPIIVKLIENEKEYEIELSLENIKPYLRPMYSMTKEEEEELRLLKNQLVNCDETNDKKFYGIISEIHNLYLSHHIDFIGLIPIGLAIEAPKGMYDINEK